MTAIIVVDLGYGDAGKGAVVDGLSQTYRPSAVVRFNGGAQALHHVVREGGPTHAFSQFGSGTFQNAETFLSRFVVVNPSALVMESLHLRNRGVSYPLNRVVIDEQAPLTTPFHIAVNRLREMSRGKWCHGSCGMGVGETVSDVLANPEAALRAGDMRNMRVAREKLVATQERMSALAVGFNVPATDEALRELQVLQYDLGQLERLAGLYAELASRVALVDGPLHLAWLLRSGPVIFEGAQGVLLDEWYGWHPYTTWSTTTPENARALLSEVGHEAVTTLGVVRAYMTRHGPGPFVTESVGMTREIPDMHNGTGRWQKGFRVGYFDAVAVRYAVDVCGGVDGLAVTCLDRAENDARRQVGWPVAVAYKMPSDELERIPVLSRGGLSEGEFLSEQETMGDMLYGAQPRYTLIPPKAPLAEVIAGMVGVPLEVKRFGPTTSAQQLVRPQVAVAG